VAKEITDQQVSRPVLSALAQIATSESAKQLTELIKYYRDMKDGVNEQFAVAVTYQMRDQPKNEALRKIVDPVILKYKRTQVPEIID